MESRARTLKKIEQIEIQSLDHGFQDCSERPPGNLGILDLALQRLKFNLFNLFQSPNPGFQDCSETPSENLGILDLGFQRLKFNRFNLFQSPESRLELMEFAAAYDFIQN